jgi:hypothetical protein
MVAVVFRRKKKDSSHGRYAEDARKQKKKRYRFALAEGGLSNWTYRM